MSEYIIKKANEQIHYFCNSNHLLCCETNQSGHSKENKVLPIKIKNNFCLYCDNKIHIICCSETGELNYVDIDNGSHRIFPITVLKPEIELINLSLYKLEGHLYLFYSIKYKNEFLLVQCILENGELPKTITAANSPYFFVHNDKLFFTDKNNDLGFLELPSQNTFVKILPDAEMPYLLDFNSYENIVCVQNDRIYFNNIPVVQAQNIYLPIIGIKNNNINIIWQDGSFIRYITEEDRGWSGIKQIISHGVKPRVIEVFEGNRRYLQYGTESTDDILSSQSSCRNF